MDRKEIAKILNANKQKEFVKRIMEPDKYPTLDNKDGSYSTHSMSWGEQGGKYYVFPTVAPSGMKGEMKRYGGRDAWKRAMQTGDFIQFNRPSEADTFSKEYKKVWAESPRE